MEYIYIDAALLAIPNYAIDTSSAEKLFRRVSHFAGIAVSNRAIQLVLSHDVEELLWNENLGPSYEQIQEFVHLMNLKDVFSAADLTRVYQTLLAFCVRALTHNGFEVSEVLSFQSTPKLPGSLSPLGLSETTCRTITEVAALNMSRDVWSAVSAFDFDWGTALQVDATIRGITGHCKEITDHLPMRAYGSVRVLSCIEDLALYLSSRRLWQNAFSNTELLFALEIGCLEFLRANHKPLSSINQFSIGATFLESLRIHECLGSGKFSNATFDLCIQLITGTCRRHVGPFGKPKQHIRLRDQARGHRVHLNKHSPALRLMFWNINGRIEFANVGLKAALLIEQG